MGQDGTAHDGQVGIGAHKVMGQQGDKLQQPGNGLAAHLHGPVLTAQYDAVLVVIHIRGILQKPGLVPQGERDQPVVAPGSLVGAAQIALVLPAQGALGIAGLGGVFGGGNGFGVFLRFGQVDGDDQIPILRGGGPQLVLFDAVHPDVVGGAAQAVIVIGGGLFVLLIQLVELAHHFRGPGHQAVHQLGVELIPGILGIRVDNALLGGTLAQDFQGLHRGVELFLHRLGIVLPQAQQGQHPVGGVGLVFRGNQAPLQAILDQTANLQAQCSFFHRTSPFHRDWFRPLLYYTTAKETSFIPHHIPGKYQAPPKGRGWRQTHQPLVGFLKRRSPSGCPKTGPGAQRPANRQPTPGRGWASLPPLRLLRGGSLPLQQLGDHGKRPDVGFTGVDLGGIPGATGTCQAQLPVDQLHRGFGPLRQ